MLTSVDRVKLPFDNNAVSNNARFLQHDVLLENNAVGVSTHAWVLARGMTVSQAGHFVESDSSLPPGVGRPPCQDAVRDYRNCVAVARQELGPGGSTQRFVIRASERNEPLYVIRLADDSPALIGLEWSGDDFDRVIGGKKPNEPARFRYWTIHEHPDPGDSGSTVVLPEETKSGFLDMPATIANLRGVNEPLLILTRVRALGNDGKPGKDDDDSSAIEMAFFEMVVAKIEGGTDEPLKITRLGSANCELRLSDQLLLKNLGGSTSIRERANRAYDQDASAPLAIGTPVWQKGKQDLFQRWKMSQVLVSDTNPNGLAQRLAVTVVFRGFVDMSLQLRLKASKQEVAFDRQLGGRGFAVCHNGLARY
jgi:hypothetical protein